MNEIQTGALFGFTHFFPSPLLLHFNRLGDKNYGGINVAVISGEQASGYLMTQLRIRKDRETRVVKHFWYTDWPDHGVPTDVIGTLAMLEQISLHKYGWT